MQTWTICGTTSRPCGTLTRLATPAAGLVRHPLSKSGFMVKMLARKSPLLKATKPLSTDQSANTYGSPCIWRLNSPPSMVMAVGFWVGRLWSP